MDVEVEVEAPGVVGYSSVDVLLCCCEVEDLARRLNSVSYNAILNKPLGVEPDSGRKGRCCDRIRTVKQARIDCRAYCPVRLVCNPFRFGYECCFI